jgi:hypothetical protein
MALSDSRCPPLDFTIALSVNVRRDAHHRGINEP